MRRLIIAAAFGAGALVLPMTSASAGCGTTTDLGGLAYVNDAGGVWVYIESNGQPGLQQGGSSLAGENAPCDDGTTPDTLVI